MRKVLPVVLALGVAACGAPLRWEKPSATDESTAADMTACRQAAQQEANRYSPFGYYPWGFGPPVWGLHRGNWMLWQMRQDNDRFYAENRLTAFCMRTKGYEQVEVRQPQTQAPPAPSPSREPPLPK
jgi:hypothetical protein